MQLALVVGVTWLACAPAALAGTARDVVFSGPAPGDFADVDETVVYDVLKEPNASIIEPCQMQMGLYGPWTPDGRAPYLLGAGRVRLRLNREQRVLLHLTARGVALLRGRRHVRVWVAITNLYGCRSHFDPSRSGAGGFPLAI